jgi:hypothetical protein
VSRQSDCLLSKAHKPRLSITIRQKKLRCWRANSQHLIDKCIERDINASSKVVGGEVAFEVDLTAATGQLLLDGIRPEAQVTDIFTMISLKENEEQLGSIRWKGAVL